MVIQQKLEKSFYLCLLGSLLFAPNVHAQLDDSTVNRSVIQDSPTAVTTVRSDSAASAEGGWVPPGFESLNEPQTMEVDIWYGGYYLTSSLARFDFSELVLLLPDEVVALIPDLIAPEGEIRTLLSEPLATNSGMACRSAFEVDCGRLETEEVGIIFDRTYFRLSLFVGSKYLSVIDSTQSQYLADSSASLSALIDNDIFFSGGDNQALTYNLSNETQVSLGESRILLRSNWTDENGFVFDSIGVQREYQGRDLQFGLIRGNATGFEFMNSEQFIGVSYGSSLSTRTDLQQSYGNEIFLFFTSRSLVEIFRANQLVYSGYYDVGNNLIDTANLPDGSYEVEIRITDASGNTDIVRRFYSKSARLAPTDEGIFFLQAGSSVITGSEGAIPEQLTSFARAGYSKRLGPDLGASFGLASNEESSLAEFSLTKLSENFELSSGLAYETDKTLGLSADFRYRTNLLNFDIGIRNVLKQGELGLLNEDLSQLGAERTSYRANLSFPSRLGRLNFFYRTSSRSSLPIGPQTTLFDPEIGDSPDFDDQNYGLRWNFSMSNFSRGQLRMNAEISRNNDETIAIFGLSFNFGNRRRRYSFAPRVLTTDDGLGNSATNAQGNASAGLVMGDNDQHRLDLRAFKQAQSMLEATYRTEAFNTNNDFTARYDLDEKLLSYNGRLSSTLATTGNARAFGSSQNGGSAFLVSVDGALDDETSYEVLVNGSPRGETKVGRTLLVPVAPYSDYQIMLIARGDTLVNLRENDFSRTVYPGNVVALNWEAISVYIAYGKLLDGKGQPVPNAVITSAGAITVTDDQGFFQVELASDTEFINVRLGSANCQLEIIPPEEKVLVTALGEMRCNELTPN